MKYTRALPGSGGRSVCCESSSFTSKLALREAHAGATGSCLSWANTLVARSMMTKRFFIPFLHDLSDYRKNLLPLHRRVNQPWPSESSANVQYALLSRERIQ